jgi:hypothetical protein
MPDKELKQDLSREAGGADHSNADFSHGFFLLFIKLSFSISEMKRFPKPTL